MTKLYCVLKVLKGFAFGLPASLCKAFDDFAYHTSTVPIGNEEIHRNPKYQIPKAGMQIFSQTCHVLSCQISHRRSCSDVFQTNMSENIPPNLHTWKCKVLLLDVAGISVESEYEDDATTNAIHSINTPWEKKTFLGNNW